MKQAKLLALLLGVGLAASGFAALSGTYEEWADGPAGLIMTKKEQKEFKKLASDADAEKFIELFWARRDPDLETAVNEFKADFDLRVEAADTQFGYGKVRGAVTDRGRTLIIMGQPSRQNFFPAGTMGDNMQNAPGQPSTGLGEVGGGAYQDRGATEVWEYLPDKLPEGVKANSVLFIFRESRVGYGDFNLDRGERRNAQALKILGDAPERLLLHPKLEEVPRVGFLAGSTSASAADLAVLDGGEKWPEGAAVRLAEGVVSASRHPLWVWLQVPSAVAPASRAVGRVASASGEVVGTFDVAVQAREVANARAYELSFPVDAGEWKVDLALLDATGPVVIKSIAATTQPVPSEGVYISPFYWGVDVQQQSTAKLGDPFNVGGWHVVPVVDDGYTTKDNVSYFCYILRPTLDEQQKSKFQVTLALHMGERKLTETPPQDVQISQVNGDLWMFGHGLPLQSFRRGGDFKLVVTLKDTLSDASRSTEIPMHVTKVDAAGNPVVEQP